MFVQVIEGTAGDAAGLRAALDRWARDLAPGAPGWLGATAGVADDGTFLAAVRFAGEDDARRNSARPEQGAWWRETAGLLAGAARFSDYPQAEVYGEGDALRAGFVQVLRGRSRDTARLRQLGREMEPALRAHRPDLLGGIACWDAAGDFADLVYFTSEAEARAGERQRIPELDRALEEFGRLLGDMRFIDLRAPWLARP